MIDIEEYQLFQKEMKDNPWKFVELITGYKLNMYQKIYLQILRKYYQINPVI